jgi:hypothetical protein
MKKDPVSGQSKKFPLNDYQSISSFLRRRNVAGILLRFGKKRALRRMGLLHLKLHQPSF